MARAGLQAAARRLLPLLLAHALAPAAAQTISPAVQSYVVHIPSYAYIACERAGVIGFQDRTCLAVLRGGSGPSPAPHTSIRRPAAACCAVAVVGVLLLLLLLALKYRAAMRRRMDEERAAQRLREQREAARECAHHLPRRRLFSALHRAAQQLWPPCAAVPPTRPACGSCAACVPCHASPLSVCAFCFRPVQSRSWRRAPGRRAR